MSETFGQRLRTIETDVFQKKQHLDTRNSSFNESLRTFITNDIQPLLEQIAEELSHKNFDTKIGTSPLREPKVITGIRITAQESGKVYIWRLASENDSQTIKLETTVDEKMIETTDLTLADNKISVYEDSIANLYEKILTEHYCL